MEEYINELAERCREHGVYKEFDETYVKIDLCKQYLKETDYTIIKIYEAAVQGGSILSMLAEYKEVFTKRKEAREMINKLESESLN